MVRRAGRLLRVSPRPGRPGVRPQHGAAPVDLPPGQLLLSSTALVDGKLPPNAAVWLV